MEISEMNKILGESGIFEQIPGAVRPLTKDGDFRLDSITYGYPERSIDITLISSDIEVIFTFLEWKGMGLANCFFVAKSMDLEFEGNPLFLAMDIDIPVLDRIIDPFFIPKTESIGEVLRLSSGIKRHLSKIRSFLSQDHISETIQRYRAEVESQNNLQHEELQRKKQESGTRPPQQLNRWNVIELPKKEMNLREILHGSIQDNMARAVPHGELPKGKLGTILASINPDPNYLFMIVYFVSTDTFDISCGKFDARAFIHQESSGDAALYFLIPPYDPQFTFIDDHIDLENSKKMVIFPGETVFGLLGIPYPDKNKKMSTGELYHLVVKNILDLHEAFSPKKIEQTYTKLKSLDGKIDNGVQRAVQKFYSRALRTEQIRKFKNGRIKLLNDIREMKSRSIRGR
jgi:hypothetical protein